MDIILSNLKQLSIYALAFVGLLVVLNYVFENLRSPFYILRYYVLCIVRGEKHSSLVKRFGQWAGEKECIFY